MKHSALSTRHNWRSEEMHVARPFLLIELLFLVASVVTVYAYALFH